MSEPAAFALLRVVRTYIQATERLEVLRGASLSVAAGELTALTGPSGSGKSTLLHIAGLLEWPDGGDVVVNGISCATMSDDQRTIVRRRQIGFVYQFHHLLPEFSALENILLPQLIAGIPKKSATAWAYKLLVAVGLKDRANHRPARLSGGEQQRIAIARALANRPQILLADEPTGNLDQHAANEVFEVLIDLVKKTNLATLIATHNHELTKRVDRVVNLQEGLIIDNSVGAIRSAAN
jgi:lipoprotein-releasing system ATP-binding protein